MDWSQFTKALLVIFFAITWTNIFLMVLLCFALYLFYRLNKGSGDFAIDDLFLTNRKADLYKVIVAIMACLSVWAVATLVLHDKPIETLLLGILGIFVGGRAAQNIWGKTESRTPEDDSGKVGDNEKIRGASGISGPEPQPIPDPAASDAVPVAGEAVRAPDCDDRATRPRRVHRKDSDS